MPGVAERRLKVSIGSSVQASLRDAQPFPTAIPWAQAHGYHHAVAPRLLKKRAVENWGPLGAHFAFGAPGHIGSASRREAMKGAVDFSPRARSANAGRR